MDELDKLVQFLNDLPNVAHDLAIKATKEQIDKEKDKMQTFFVLNSGSQRLNEHMQVSKYDNSYEYGYSVDWSDQKVNPIPIKKYKIKSISRKKGKRNYTIAPATWHDFAYIKNFGTDKIIGNYFINRAVRRLRNMDKRIDERFRKEIRAEMRARS